MNLEKLKTAKSPLEARREYFALTKVEKEDVETKEVLAELRHKFRKLPYLLFFDTETVGLPINYRTPYFLDKTGTNWPRIIQIGFIKTDFEGNEVARYETLVNPKCPISPEAQEVTGITQEMVEEDGADIEEVLTDVNILFDGVANLIAHNVNFDQNVLGAEFMRNGIWWDGGKTRPYCTMNNSAVISYVGAVQPAGHKMAGRLKWPTLTELHTKLFGEGFDGAHDAMVDIEVTAKCFFEMRKRNII